MSPIHQYRWHEQIWKKSRRSRFWKASSKHNRKFDTQCHQGNLNLNEIKTFPLSIQVEHILRIPENQLAINGGCRLQILKRFLFSIVDRNFLTSFTWTGKSKGTERKISFAKYERILERNVYVSKKKWWELSTEYIQNIFVDRILKYAYEYVFGFFFDDHIPNFLILFVVSFKSDKKQESGLMTKALPAQQQTIGSSVQTNLSPKTQHRIKMYVIELNWIRVYKLI